MRNKTKTMTRGALAVLIVAILVTPLLGQESLSEPKVAVVNGSVITQGKFNVEVFMAEQTFSQMGRDLDDSMLAEIRKRTLEQLIEQELLYQESKKKGIEVEESVTDKRFEELKNIDRGKLGFEGWLKKMGLTEAELREQITMKLAVNEFFIKEFVRKAKVPEKQMRNLYETNKGFFKEPKHIRARHILIKVDPKAEKSQKAKARKRIEQIAKKLRNGEDFATLAKEASQGPSSSKGGDLGYFSEGTMTKPFEDAAFALKAGDLSDVVETEFGYHLIQVTDKKPKKETSFQEAKEKLRQYLKRYNAKVTLKAYVQELKAKAEVERYLKTASQ